MATALSDESADPHQAVKAFGFSSGWGEHTGGSDPFGFDVTDAIHRLRINHLELHVVNGLAVNGVQYPRIILVDGDRILGGQDFTFGHRSFRYDICFRRCRLNGKPFRFRGTSTINSLNIAYLAGDEEKLVDQILLAKAAGGGSVRVQGEPLRRARIPGWYVNLESLELGRGGERETAAGGSEEAVSCEKFDVIQRF